MRLLRVEHELPLETPHLVVSAGVCPFTVEITVMTRSKL